MSMHSIPDNRREHRRDDRRDNRTRTDLHGRANLDIKLEGWPGAVAVGFVSAAAAGVAIYGLNRWSKR